ncbi:hypothetical protein Brms1b_013545 [Colletotrichum noveboracense]|nr:hypothetical protein Brms1b_013545 [Colletotrichum noveboracense]
MKRFTIAVLTNIFYQILGGNMILMILAYTYPPEILRYSQRAKGVVVAQAIGYAFSFLNLYTAPLAIERISWRYYAINGGWNLGILAVVYCLFVETKGRTLEEIDEVFDGVVYSNDVIIDAQGSKGTLEQDGEDNKSLTKRKLRKVDSAN